MYAVIKTGGKQYRVSEGDKLAVEKLAAEAGSDVSIEEVLMVADGEDVTIGTPTVAGASVTARVIAHDRAAKINIIKFKRRKHYRRQAGHRQHQTHLEITKISKG